jgi:hypothetical protein
MTNFFETPILFQIYNSLDTSVAVFNEIRKQRPTQLFIVQDGFRKDYPNEQQECLLVRDTILNMIDWECNLITLFRENNLGPGAGTADAIKWFFNQVEFGIFLEHDCLPHPDFFEYCSVLLEKYKSDNRIKLINGSNYQVGKKFGSSSYYFGVTGQLWGWAAWRETFIDYTADINQFEYSKLLNLVNATFDSKREQAYWMKSYRYLKEGLVNTWDYQLLYKIWNEKGLIVIPNVNLISNIGFGSQAIHCQDENSSLSNAKIEAILPLKHPRKIKRNYKSDLNYHDHYLVENIQPNLFVQVKRKIRKLLS